MLAEVAYLIFVVLEFPVVCVCIHTEGGFLRQDLISRGSDFFKGSDVFKRSDLFKDLISLRDLIPLTDLFKGFLLRGLISLKDLIS